MAPLYRSVVGVKFRERGTKQLLTTPFLLLATRREKNLCQHQVGLQVNEFLCEESRVNPLNAKAS